MYIYHIGSEAGAARELSLDYARAKKLGWVIHGSIQLERNAPEGEFLAIKQTAAGHKLPKFVAGDCRTWVAASSRDIFEEFVGLFLPESE